MNTLAIIIVFLSFIAIWRKLQQSYAERKFKYNMYALRDRLRNHAINDAVPSDSWIFDYYDRSFSKAIKESYFLTFFRLAKLEVKYVDNDEFEKFKKKVEKETSIYPELKQIREDYFNYTKKYLLRQHFVTACTFFVPIVTAIIGGTIIATYIKKIIKYSDIIKNTIFFPETSDSMGKIRFA